MAFRSLKDLLGEREKAIAVAAKATTQPQTLTLEEWEKLRTPEALRAQLKADKRLPPEVREDLQRRLRPNPQRARELQAIADKSGTDVYKRQGPARR